MWCHYMHWYPSGDPSADAPDIINDDFTIGILKETHQGREGGTHKQATKMATWYSCSVPLRHNCHLCKTLCSPISKILFPLTFPLYLPPNSGEKIYQWLTDNPNQPSVYRGFPHPRHGNCSSILTIQQHRHSCLGRLYHDVITGNRQKQRPWHQPTDKMLFQQELLVATWGIVPSWSRK